jgi:hypothetical protein
VLYGTVRRINPVKGGNDDDKAFARRYFLRCLQAAVAAVPGGGDMTFQALERKPGFA